MREDEEEYLSGDFFDAGEDVVLFPSRTMECIQAAARTAEEPCAWA